MREQQQINQVLESLHQVRCVNQLIQGVCARMGTAELSATEARGLWVVLDWQNEKVCGAEGIIKTMAVGKVANAAA